MTQPSQVKNTDPLATLTQLCDKVGRAKVTVAEYVLLLSFIIATSLLANMTHSIFYVKWDVNNPHTFYTK